MHRPGALALAGTGALIRHLVPGGALLAGLARQPGDDLIEVAVRFERQRQGGPAIQHLVQRQAPVVERRRPGLAVALDLAGVDSGAQLLQ